MSALGRFGRFTLFHLLSHIPKHLPCLCVENHIRDVCELKASVYLQQFIAWKGELLFDLVTTSVDVILDVFGNLCACGIY